MNLLFSRLSKDREKWRKKKNKKKKKMSVVGIGVPNALYSQLIISLQLPLSTHHLIASLFFLHLPFHPVSLFSLFSFLFPLHLHSPTPQQARWWGESWSQAGSQATDHLPSLLPACFRAIQQALAPILTNTPRNTKPLGREQRRPLFFFFFCFIIACDLGNKHPSPLLLQFALRYAALTSSEGSEHCRL